MSLASALTSYVRLGLVNILRVAGYRLALKAGVHPVLMLSSEIAAPPFFHAPECRRSMPTVNTTWNEGLWWFGWHREPWSQEPPDWFASPFTPEKPLDASQDWWRIPDFGHGDIKGAWELSRLDWVVALATGAANGDAAALQRLNYWLADWAAKNPPYKGPHWKCGQEASIRVMHLVLAAWILQQDQTPSPGLTTLLVAHLQRIAPTMSYAIGQQNNHGTSEAAALFMGGSFLRGHDSRAERWLEKGRHWLEERAQTLIEPDGSFSQYSVNYHRLMLDTYALAEAWRIHRGLPPFSATLRGRLVAATGWLEAMTNSSTGDAPNLGANDGARLIPLTRADYRDFRPSVQLAAALFEDRDAYGEGEWNVPLFWLDVPFGKPDKVPTRTTFDHGGYQILRLGQAMAVLRYPRFRFRPSHADALHLDFWLADRNVFRDGGTFGYNTESQWLDYFPGTAAHNTVQFDDRDQMPRLSRFLFGDWLKVKGRPVFTASVSQQSAAVAYRDGWGATHHRHVVLEQGAMKVVDQVSGFDHKAVLRWRLMPGDWQRQGDGWRLGDLRLIVQADVPIRRMEMVQGWESRYYLKKTPLPVLEVEVGDAGALRSRIEWIS